MGAGGGGGGGGGFNNQTGPILVHIYHAYTLYLIIIYMSNYGYAIYNMQELA